MVIATGQSANKEIIHRHRLREASVSVPVRRSLIAERAYFLAEDRGFSDGDPVRDWLDAEAAVDRALRALGEEERAQELSAFEALRRSVEDRLARLRRPVDARNLRQALEHGARDLRQARRHSAATIQKAVRALRKDMLTTAERLEPRWDRLTTQAECVFRVWRDRGSAFVEAAGGATVNWLRSLRDARARNPYRAGDMAAEGRFECTACGGLHEQTRAGYLRPCGQCGGTEFKRL